MRTILDLILISNKMIDLKSRVLCTLVAHVPCATSYKNLFKIFIRFNYKALLSIFYKYLKRFINHFLSII